MTKRKLLLFSFLALCAGVGSAAAKSSGQLYDPYLSEPLPHDAPQWLDDIAKDPAGVNFYEMQRKYRQWIAGDVDARVKTIENKPAVNFYRRWMAAYRDYVAPDGSIRLPSVEDYALKVDSMNRHVRERSLTGSPIWRNIGPNETYENVGGAVKRKDHQVCVFRIAVSLSDKNTLYCGTESGVVFKTTDHGQTWQPCAPQHNFGGSIYSIAIDPVDKNTVYVGGGPWLWKTTDGGDSWTRCPGITYRANSIRINPNDPRIVTVAAGGGDDDNNGGGFYISFESGESFMCSLSGTCFDHELKPGDPDCIYLVRRELGVWADIYKSIDGGFTWQKAELPVSRVICGRLAVSQAPDGEDYVYALVTSDPYGSDAGPKGGKGTPYILMSKDAGATWVNQTDVGGKYWDVTFSPIMDAAGGQGYFDMMIGASAQNPAHVLFGLTSLYRSTNEGICNYRDHGIGGYQRSDWMHCDIQDIAVHPCGDTWICNDGGIKYSSDFFETKGEDRHDGVYASDYQGLGVGWNEDVMAAGRWHNGDVVHAASYGEGKSVHVGGVEIATGYVMKSNPWKVYFTDAMTRIMPREIDGTIESDVWTWFSDKKPLEVLRINGEIATDPRYALKVFLQDMTDTWGGYLSFDEGASFSKVFDSEGEDFYSYDFARSNPERMYISGAWNVWRSDDGGLSFTEVTQPFPITDDYIHFTRVVIDPNDEDHVLVICNDKYGAVSESFDGGLSWSQFDLANLSDIRVHYIILVGDEHGSCYVTSYDGANVYFRDNSMTEFIDYSAGLNPGARISKVVPFYKGAVLRMATNQGLWEAPLYHQEFTPVAQPMALNLGSGDLTANPQKEVQFDSYSIVRQDENTRWKWTFSPQPMYVSDASVRNPRVVFGNPGEYDVTLTVTTPSGTSSRTIKKMITIGGASEIEDVEVLEVGMKKAVLSRGESAAFIASGLDIGAVISIHDMKGRLLHQVTLQNRLDIVSVPLNLPTGVYVYSINDATRKYFGQFVIK
ncbi:MAG: T9SS type A sorting domain-containing protein [Bacteroidales bacterium]|nr:T9SS type A sorting domain-containing protein [Bacteroidales bacterium]